MSKRKQSKNKKRNVVRKAIGEEIKSFKTERGCNSCDEKHPACLTFHHKDPTIKVNTVAKLIRNRASHKVILEEISKCEVMCLNCHAKLHYDEDNNGP